MGKSYFREKCIDAIRHEAFGKNNREPIAYSIESVEKENVDLPYTEIVTAQFGDFGVELINESILDDYKLVINPPDEQGD